MVDDNQAHLYAIIRFLQGAGFKVLEASTGNESLKRAEQMPDLIVLDVNLPDVNGFEVCQRLKANPATAKIPIVFLSNTYDPSAGKEWARYFGAQEFLIHPIQGEQLTTIINGVLAKSRAEAAKTSST